MKNSHRKLHFRGLLDFISECHNFPEEKKNKNEVIFLQQVVINKKVIKGKRGCSNLLTSRKSAMPEHKNPSTFVNPPVQLIHHANLDKLQQRDGPSWLTISQVTGHIIYIPS